MYFPACKWGEVDSVQAKGSWGEMPVTLQEISYLYPIFCESYRISHICSTVYMCMFPKEKLELFIILYVYSRIHMIYVYSRMSVKCFMYFHSQITAWRRKICLFSAILLDSTLKHVTFPPFFNCSINQLNILNVIKLCYKRTRDMLKYSSKQDCVKTKQSKTKNMLSGSVPVGINRCFWWILWC